MSNPDPSTSDPSTSDPSASSHALEPAPDRRDIVVVGASAGGVEALAEFASCLPPNLPAAVFVVLHMPAYGHSVLPDILNRRGPLPAAHPEDGETIQTGRIYVAPPDYHLLVEKGRILLTRGPAENNHRPAVDTLFRSAAYAYGPRVTGVILSGTLDDGTAGLQAVKMRGGAALVQHPDEAMFSGMPRSALENVAVDAVLPITALAETVARLAEASAAQEELPVASEPDQPNPMPPNLEEDVAVEEMHLDALEGRTEGKPSGFSCPDCHGVLWEISEGELIRFRCRVGHAFSPESLFASQSSGLEEALWAALRALEESAALAERLQSRSSERGHVLSAQRFAGQAQNARTRAATIHDVLTGGQIVAAPDFNPKPEITSIASAVPPKASEPGT